MSNFWSKTLVFRYSRKIAFLKNCHHQNLGTVFDILVLFVPTMSSIFRSIYHILITNVYWLNFLIFKCSRNDALMKNQNEFYLRNSYHFRPKQLNFYGTLIFYFPPTLSPTQKFKSCFSISKFQSWQVILVSFFIIF